MKLPYKITIIFGLVVLLSVGTSLFALREMDRLAANIETELFVTIPTRELLVSLHERIDGAFNLKRQLLSPHLPFAERWAYVQQYKKQRDDVHLTRNTLEKLFTQAVLPETIQLWNSQRELFAKWEESDTRMEMLLQSWFRSGIASPDRLSMLLRQFEADQTAMLRSLEKTLLQLAPTANAQTGADTGCALQQWLDRLDESRRLYDDGAWDGIRPQRLSDGSLTEELAKNDGIMAQQKRMQADHALFHRALNDAKAAIEAGKRPLAVGFLKESTAANDAMVASFQAMHREGQRVAGMVGEAQDIELRLRSYRAQVMQAMTAIIDANSRELFSQGALAVKSVESTVRNMWLLLAVFVFLCAGLGGYGIVAYRRNQKDLHELQHERETAFAQMHFLFNTFPMGCLLRDHQHRLRNCNQAAARLFGIEEQWEEMEENARAFGLEDKWEYLERYAALLNPEFQPDGELSKEKDRQLFRKAFEVGQVKTEWMYQTAKGEPLPAEVTLLRTEWDGQAAIVYHIRDLREEKALRAAEEDARESINVLFGSAPMGCQICDENAAILDCNPAMFMLMGACSKEEFIANRDYIMGEFQPCGRKSADLIKERAAAVMETGYQRFEWLYRRLDGEMLPADVVLKRVMLHGRPSMACYVHDMRSIKAMLAEVEEANRRTRILFENAPFSCHIRYADGLIEDCNDQTLRIYGLKSKEEFNRRFSSLSPLVQPDGQLSSERMLMQIRAAFETGYQNFRWQYLKVDGTPFPAEVTLIRINWEGNPALACYVRPLHDDRRNAVRHAFTRPCHALWRRHDGAGGQMQIVDISSTGLCAQGDVAMLQVGQSVELDCAAPFFSTSLHGVLAQVRWVSGAKVGLEFESQLAENIEMLTHQFNQMDEA